MEDVGYKMVVILFRGFDVLTFLVLKLEYSRHQDMTRAAATLSSLRRQVISSHGIY